MSKNPVSKSKPVKRNEPMHNALKFFLAGCVAEIYLLVIRRFYVNVTANELLACDAALPYLMAAGAAVAVIGLVLGIVWRQQTKRRWIGWSVFAAGVFLGGSAWMIRTFYDSALTFLCVVVPVVMLLDILWSLVTALIGAYLLASGFEGFFFRWSLKWFERPLMILGAVMLIVPGMVTDLVGIAIIVVEFVTEFMFKRSEKFVPVTVSQSTT